MRLVTLSKSYATQTKYIFVERCSIPISNHIIYRAKQKNTRVANTTQTFASRAENENKLQKGKLSTELGNMGVFFTSVFGQNVYN